MALKPVAFAALFAALPLSALAEIIADDPYMRTSRPGAPTGAAFMALTNTGDATVRIVGVETDIAPRAELHTHIDAGDGVMQMREVEGGFVIEPGETLMLKRGGDHLMFMGLSEAYATGDSVTVSLILESGAPVTLDIPVDNERMDMDHDH